MNRNFSEVMDSDLFREEYFVSEIQSRLALILDEKGISRAELARKLGVSRPRVTQIFSDEAKNFTIRLLFSVFAALGEEPVILTKREYRNLRKKQEAKPEIVAPNPRGFGGLSDQLIAELLKDKINFSGGEADRASRSTANTKDWAETGSNVISFERAARA